MQLSEVRIKNLEREDIVHLKDFSEVINSHDNLEMSIPDHAIEYILSQDEMRQGVFLAYLEDKFIGFAGCFKNNTKGKDASFEMIIHPDYRQKGLGRMLYEKIYAHAKEKEVVNVTVYAKERMQQSVSFLQNRDFKINKYMWKMDFNLKEADYRILPLEKCNIRTATNEDSIIYADIMNAGFKNEGEELYTEKSFEMTFKNPDAKVFLIEYDGELTATAAVTLEKGIKRGYIYNVTVYKQHRGKGFGEMAINHCINFIKEAGMDKASLSVDGTNSNALNLYKKLGFVEKDTDIVFKREL